MPNAQMMELVGLADGSVQIFMPPDPFPLTSPIDVPNLDYIMFVMISPIPDDPITSAKLTFKQLDTGGWPFQGQTEKVLTVTPDMTLETIPGSGDWDFSVELYSEHRRRYSMPDPELQIGDGADLRPV